MLGSLVILGSACSFASDFQYSMYGSETEYKWALAASFNQVYMNDLGQTMTLQDLQALNSTQTSIALSYRLDSDNELSKIFAFTGAKLEPTIMGTYWSQGTGPAYEGSVYLNFRWIGFPWNDFLATTMSVGEGISYMSSVPDVENLKANYGSNNTRQLLNLLVLEVTVANPQTPYIQYFVDIHHRSGAYGTYNNGGYGTGSNALGGGVRYYFE
ncbi:MAG: hypothetical protein NTX05_01985 [Fusobacteria bacterium]|nr:hypothetical protein [Fusobacteriota bacterium]